LGYAGAQCGSGLGLGSGQHILPHSIRLVVSPDLGHIQCRSVDADRHGVRVLELSPVPDDRLGARIDGESAHGQHGGGSIYGKHYVAIAGDPKDAAQVRFLDGGRWFTLAMGGNQASSVKDNRLVFSGLLRTWVFSLGTDYAHVLPISDAQEIQVFQQGDGMGHLQ